MQSAAVRVGTGQEPVARQAPSACPPTTPGTIRESTPPPKETCREATENPRSPSAYATQEKDYDDHRAQDDGSQNKSFIPISRVILDIRKQHTSPFLLLLHNTLHSC